MSNVIGTPDWQRGTVNAQKLIATIPGGTASAVVNLPANTTKIGIAQAGDNFTGTYLVQGNTSGLKYPETLVPGSSSASASSFSQFDVLSMIDTSVTITFSGFTNLDPFYVYTALDVLAVSTPDLNALIQSENASNSGVGVNVFAVSGGVAVPPLVDSFGRTIPISPLNAASLILTAGFTQVLAAPATQNWYLFGYDVAPNGAMTAGTVELAAAGTVISMVAVDPTKPTSIDLHGFITSGAVTALYSGTNAQLVLRYAPGP